MITSLKDVQSIDLKSLDDDQLGELVKKLDSLVTDSTEIDEIEGAFFVVENELHKRRFEEARKKYPHACIYCGGFGLIHHPGSYDCPPETDLCKCLEKERCPVCAEKVTLIEGKTEDHYECEHCGFDERKGEEVLPSCPF